MEGCVRAAIWAIILRQSVVGETHMNYRCFECDKIHIFDSESTDYFFVFGQVGILMNQKISMEECTRRIQ